MRRYVLVALSVSLFGVAQAQNPTVVETHGKVLYGGKPVGTTVVKVFSGSTEGYDSTTKFEIGPQKVDSHLAVTTVKGIPTKILLEETSGKATGIVSWVNGKLNVTFNGKQQVKDKTVALKAPIFTAFHPQVAGAIFKEFTAKKNPAKVDVLSLNALTTMSPETTVKPMTAEVKSGPLAINHFTLKYGGIDIIYAVDDQNRVYGFNIPAQMFQIVADDFEGVFVDPLSKFPELSKPTYTITNETRIKMATRDGVVLFSDIARPNDSMKHPTILIRTPYGRAASIPAYEYLARRGYVVISQDVRGRGASGGEWDPLNHEVRDGDDTLNWIAHQPWSDGGVGMIGGSYLGFVQWAAAVNHNPILKCIIPQVSPPDPMHNLPWDNGTFMLAPGLWWSRIVKEHQADMAAAAQGISDMSPFGTMPLSQVDNVMFKQNIPFFDLWLKRPRLADWPGSFTEAQVATVKIPVMHISGIWDGDGIGTLLHWEELRANGGNQWLVFGPWEHGFNIKTKFGDQDYGPDAVLELDSSYLRFFDTFLKGKDVGLNDRPRARVFVTGANRWSETSDWPPKDAELKTVFLAGTAAGGPKSAGTLAAAPNETKDRYVYDPAKMKPPKKGFDVDSGKTVTYTSRKSLRPGDLVYSSAPFKSKTVVAGPLEAELYFSTTAKDANLHVAAFDEAPDGKVWIIGMQGNGRVSYMANGAKPLTPGKVYKVTIKPWLFAREFGAGHRLTIRVTSDVFPQYARNPGTGEADFSATKMVKATHTIYKTKEYPSQVRFYTFAF